MTELMDGQVSMFDAVTEYGKMFPAHFQAQEKDTQVKTSQPSLKSSSGSQSRKLPLFLCLKKDGPQQDATTMRWESGVSHGELWTANIGECLSEEGAFVSLLTSTDSMPQRLYLEKLNTTEKPSEVVETHLSQILESDPDPKYNLSPKACQGILTRANRRGKKLPEMLESIGRAVPYTVKIRSGVDVDSNGKAAGKGALIQTDKSGTLSTVQDQYLFQPIISVDQGGGKSSVGIYEGVSPTLTRTNDGAPAVTYCIEGNGSRPSHKGDGYCESETMYTLNTTEQHAVAYSLEPGIAAREGGHIYEGVSGTLRAKAGDNQMAVAYTYDARGNGDGQKCATLTGDHQNRVTDYTSVVLEPVGEYWDGSQVAGTLTANNAGGNQRMPDKENFNCVVQKVEDPIAIDRAFFNQGKNAQYEPQCYEDGIAPTLVAKGPGAVAHGVDCRNATEYENITGSLQSTACHNHNSNNVVRVKHIVRRLTPGECELLQGFPKGWTDIGEWIDTKGKKHKEADSPRYKALGNSIALPPWKWVMKRLCACYERDATLASLFDGIGGFPYIWEQLNGKGSCLWASEIEEFPIAVTKARFGE